MVMAHMAQKCMAELRAWRRAFEQPNHFPRIRTKHGSMADAVPLHEHSLRRQDFLAFHATIPTRDRFDFIECSLDRGRTKIWRRRPFIGQ